MKRFTDYINEAKKDDDCPDTIPDICKMLGDSTPIAFRQLLKDKESIIYGFDPWSFENKKCYSKHRTTIQSNSDCREAISAWFESEKESKAGFIGPILKMGACPKKGPWACWEGTAYRGLVKSRDWLKKLNFTGEVVMKPDRNGKKIHWLVAEGIYKSKYAAQSWTSEWATSLEFSDRIVNEDDGIGLVVEMPLTKKNTLFSPKFTNEMSGYNESEIIRIGNTPTKCKMYVIARRVHRIFRDYIAMPEKIIVGPKKEQDMWFRKEWSKRLAGMVGEKNANKLIKNPVYWKFVMDTEDYSYS